MVYHIISKDQWEIAKQSGVYTPDNYEEDGFIHFSSSNQVVDVANLLYKGEKNLVLLSVDEEKTEHQMVFEDLKGHGTFPHLYGPLNVSEVESVIDFPVGEDGQFKLPDELN